MYVFITLLLVLAVGIIIRIAAPNFTTNMRSYSYFRPRRDTRKLSVGELIFGTIIVGAPVVFLAGVIAANASVNSKLTKHEYWNGYEKAAIMDVTRCEKNGECENTYSCDETTWTDSDGNTHSDWDDCPYTTEEWTFTVDTSLGPIVIAKGVLPENPTKHYYRKPGWLCDCDEIPGDLMRTAGYPKLWLAAKDRLDNNKPGPVTQVHEYKNYLLASDSTIFAKYSGDIDRYKKAGLMPDPAKGVYNIYRSEKFHVVKGAKVADKDAWNKRLETLNAVLGSKLQGDMQVIVVPADKVSVNDRQPYINAVMAYWQSPGLERDTVSKNSIVLVLGVDGDTVAWSKATTGMPGGNESLMNDLSNLTGTAFDRDILLGKVGTSLKGDAPRIGGGKVSDMVLTGPSKFQRACMECDDKGENNADGFSYLRGDVKPSGWAMVAAGTASAFLSIILWVILYQVNLGAIPVIGHAVRFIDDLVGDSENQD